LLTIITFTTKCFTNRTAIDSKKYKQAQKMNGTTNLTILDLMNKIKLERVEIYIPDIAKNNGI